MADLRGNKQLNPVEKQQVRFAAQLFEWMRHPVMAHRGRTAMERFLEELAPPADMVVGTASDTEGSLATLCASDDALRQRLGEALRHAPLYVELSARVLPLFAPAGRFEHASWLYLAPDAALRLAKMYLSGIRCPERVAEEFLETLESRVAAQEATSAADGTQAA